MNVECSDLCRCVGCHNCEPNEAAKSQYLGKRSREEMHLADISSSKINREIVVSAPQNESGYSLKPRRAKENRFVGLSDFSVELITSHKV